VVSAVRGRPRRGATVALVAVVVLLLAAGAFVGLDATGHVPGALFDDPKAEPTATSSPSPSPPAAGPVLTPATGSEGDPPDVAEELLADPDLGGDVGAYVVDVASGEVLLDRDAASARTPASVAKLATAAGALVALGPAARLETRTVAGARPGEVVLVGGGDTTLTTRPAKDGYPVPARLADLADTTAAALRARGVVEVTVSVDDSLFSGPALSPDWRPGYVGAGVVSPVSALSLDGGRVRPGFAARSASPAVAAGQRLTRLLRDRGLSVGGPVRRATATPDAETLGTVSSPELSSLVETMLSTSDNDLAESLIRLVAISRDQPATFEGGTAAVAEVLAELGVPTDGMALLDGSGLSRGSRIAPETLGALLALAAGDGADPRLRPLVTGLPVAGFSGTLAERFGTAASGRAGAGVVRAKTGTLTGVSSLAGVVARGDDSPPGQFRLLAFVLMTDDVQVSNTLDARDALDRIAAALGPDG
jgi:D-alanyl-D-alanine carboxypeptidase/D-alanyl-D-alanine-endopeptidase (penicillin-binding protein 4)